MSKLVPFTKISRVRKIARFNNAIRVLCNLSEHDRAEHWDMSTYGKRVENVCGTTACAAGWCGMDPWFRERGLRLRLRLQINDNPADPKTFRATHNFAEKVYAFFGPDGQAIFGDSTPRSVEYVIAQLQGVVRKLQRRVR